MTMTVEDITRVLQEHNAKMNELKTVLTELKAEMEATKTYGHRIEMSERQIVALHENTVEFGRIQQ